MVGTTISHYRILEKLGEGGMGEVYKAEDSKLKRTVALKFLPEHLAASEQDRIRFIQEAQAASALNHPNVCTIHGIEESSGRVFIVMEFVDGQTLRDQLTEAGSSSPIQAKQAINITIQIAEGLSAAHNKGIVHRDIKPENIILTKEGVAKIADFGLARSLQLAQASGEESIAGTIAYMSPEQLRGESLNHLTDIWSLGVVLYEMVSGSRPFTGEYEEALKYTIVHEKHPSLSSLRTDIPASLEKSIDRCLEKIPALRFPDAVTLVNELRRIGVETKSPRETVIRSIAVLPFADLSPEKDNKYFSDGLTEEIITNLSKLRNLKVVSRTSVMRYERQEKTIKQIAAELDVQYLLEGSVRKHGSDLRITTQLIDANQDASLWAEKYSGTMDEVFDIQEMVAARVVRALKLRLTPDEKKNLKRRSTENTEAYQLYLKGRFFWNKRNKDGLLTAIRYFEDAIKKDQNYALAWAGLADTYNLLGEDSVLPQKETYLKAKAAVEKALDLDDKLAEAHTSLALLIMLNEWNWTSAEREFKLAIRLNPKYATAHHWYSEWLLFMGETDQALKEISLAVEIEPLSPAILKDKGLTLYYARRYDDAIEYAKKALEIDHTFATAHRLLSLSYQAKGQFVEAIAENQRWGEKAGNDVEASLGLAQLLAVSGNKAEALRLLKSLNPESFTAGNLFRGVALVYVSLDDRDLALTWLERTYEVRSESLSSIRVDPKFDILRSEPRFIELMKKVRVMQ
jgi:serine/threonine protein kinase/Flp pilus assembly protein TadD